MPMDAQQAYPKNDPGSTFLADGAPAELHCPFLGLRHDPDTHFTFPSVNSYCHRVSPVQRIGLEHQETSCLSTNHLACPVFTGNQSDWTWKGPLPAPMSDRASLFKGRTGWLLVALAILLVILAIAAYLGTRLSA